MKNLTKKISTIVIILVGLLFYQNAFADTHNAASCSSADVAAAITAAATGDIVTIPTGACTWTSGIIIPDAKKITLKGAGATSTVITHGAVKAISMGTSGSRVTGMGFVQTTGLCIEVKGSGWRIDHNQFTNISGSSQYTIIANGTGIDVTPTGLIDNNDFVQGRIDVQGMGTFAKNSANWVKASALGTQDAVYIEDNTFYKTVGGGGNVIDSNRTNSYVARYNSVNGTTIIEFHSLQSDNERPGKSWEIYGNTFNSSAYHYRNLSIRGGTGVIFGNTHSGANTDYTLTFDNVRSYTNLPIMGLCNGSSYADGNQDATGWPCRDQIGRGPDVSLWSANTQNPAPAQTSQPAYVWLNRKGAAIAGAAVVNNCDKHIKADRDYYVEGASFDGTSGVGCGTLANRPTTCTTGVAYWATNQSCTNLAGMVGPNPSTPISGTLYKCTATNTWTAYYKPYTYPHPLRSGDVPKSTLIVSSTNGTVTSNPSGINCGSNCDFDFNSDTSVTLNAAANSGYTFSGWSGACSGTGTCTVDMTEARFVQANYSQSILHKLTVSKIGSSAGTVTSSDNLINCGSTCSANYNSGKSVTLTALPKDTKWAKYRFAGWSGACSGTGTCTLSMTAAKSVTATFYYYSYNPK